MRKIIGLILTLATLIVLSAYWKSKENGRPDGSDGSVVAATTSFNGGSQSPEDKTKELVGVDRMAPAVDPSLSPFSHLPAVRDGLPFENDPFVAESVDEQKWLDRNGYPNSEQWRAYSAATDSMLQLAAENGDKIAGVVMDSRALATGDKGAVDRLFYAAEEGSMFALSLLQAYMATSPNGDRELAYAISRVMEMKGDTRAALARDFAFPQPLSAQERMRGESIALQLHKQLKSNTKSPKFVDPRPFP